MVIVGLAGRARSGKGTTAAALVKELGFVELSFASSLKDFTARMFGWPREGMDDARFKEACAGELHVVGRCGRSSGAVSCDLAGLTISPRWALQRAGVAARETFGADFWVSVVVHQIEESQRRGRPDDARFVVSDCRFWNEIAGLRQWGKPVTKIVRLNRADAAASRHEYVVGGYPHIDQCAHYFSPGVPTALCMRPRSAHPASWTPDRHESETQLPDLGDVYDFVSEAASGQEQAANVLAYVRGLL